MRPEDLNPARLARREAAPALLTLHRALSRLSGVLTVMNTGAHPDDEQSGMLAWLRFGLGHRVVVACSTRGEGGQNALGPERGGLLGLVRSREMEEAAKVLDCDVAWLGFGPDDPVHDFGFSKDGDGTFARWGEALIVERLARAYRQYRPDVVIPTFLDVPGQHGHHRAMTRAAEAALALAADPVALAGSNLPTWAVSHYYLPAWGGGGGTYDDTLPPPPATLRIEAGAMDPATGASFTEVGQWSRRRHASQGMGHWADDPRRAWELHLKTREGEATLAASVPATLSALAASAGPAEAAISAAAESVLQAQAAFPDRAAIITALARADAALEEALALGPPDFALAHGHRLRRKRREIAAALAEAAALTPVVSVAPRQLSPGGSATIALHQTVPTAAQEVRFAPSLAGKTGAAVPMGPGKTEAAIALPADAAIASPFLPGFDPLGGNGFAWAELTASIGGRPITLRRDLEAPLEIAPAKVFAARPDAVIRRLGDPTPLEVSLANNAPVPFETPRGWQISQSGRALAIAPPDADSAGLTTIIPHLNGKPALTASHATFAHIGDATLYQPAQLRVLTLDIALPQKARIASIGSGDAAGLWLARLGLEVTRLDEIAPDEDFSAYTTVLVGVVAFGNRPDLVAATGRLHRFVEQGGHLVTLYQRPDQGWSAETTPPKYLKIGTPSLRWRVTDPQAQVSILAPEHPLLTGPNRIGPEDFAGWDKDRGLYFAARWDGAYQPLLAMSDAGEDPLTGSLVSAAIGKGRHTHTGLTLHHQLDKLVPGAFRLMANLVQPS